MMKILILIITLFPFVSKGQFAGSFPVAEPTFGQIKQRAATYYDSLLLAKGTLQGTGYSSYKRWEYFWNKRIGDAPKFSEVSQKIKDYYNPTPNTNSANLASSNYNCATAGNTWEEFGPNTFPTGVNGSGGNYQRGIGMLSFVRFHPQYNGGTQQTMYTGGASGLWKSINNGQSWSVLNTDGNKFTACADLAISPTAPNTLYLATGAEKSMSLFNVYGEPYEEYYGILRSTDGGNNWTNVAPIIAPDLQYVIKKAGRLRIHPANANVLYFVMYYHDWNGGSNWRGRIYKSIDAGSTWNMIYAATNTHLLDMEFKPNDPNTFYVAGYRLLKFTDTETGTSVLTPTDLTAQLGTGWQANTTLGVRTGEGHVNRLEIEVTPAAPNNLYVVGADYNPDPNDLTKGKEKFENLWVSTNSGTSFTTKNPTGVVVSGDIVAYNEEIFIVRQMMCLAISPTNANEIYMGGIALGKSTNGGTSFTELNTGFKIHPDNREIECVMNGTNTVLFTCNDAGLYTSSDAGTTWATRSNGLGVGRVWGLDIANTPSNQDAEKLIVGFQDCTTLIKDASGWFQPNYVIGDGMLTAIDPTNNNILYRESQNGGLDRSIDGLNFFGVNVAGGASEVAPFMLFPNSPKKLIMGREEVNIIDFTSSQTGSLTIKTNVLKNNVDKNFITSVAVAASNENIIYSAYTIGRQVNSGAEPVDKILFKSINGGNTWTDVSPSSYSNLNTRINKVLIHPTNPNKIWVVTGGYWPQVVILTSDDGGTTWQNYSSFSFPVMSIAINPNRVNDEELYIGTDAGVFFRNKYMAQWECFNNLLPNIRVTDLKINRHKKTIFAGTYGRGVWKSSLFCPSVPSYTLPTTPLGFYAASNFITSSSTISSSTIITKIAYRAPSIYLTAGFKVILGTAFSANSYSCQEYVINKIVQNNGGADNTKPTVALKKEFINSEVTSFQVHPIPTFDEITTTYGLTSNSNIYIYVTDGTGKLVKNLLRVHEQEMGNYEQKFQIGDLPNGYYLVVMESNNGVSHQKIVVQK